MIPMSGHDEQETTSELVGRGLAGFVQKPFTLASFRAAVERAPGGG